MIEHPVTIASIFPESIQHTYTHVIMLSLVIIIAMILSLFARKMTAEIPSKGQVILEGLVGGLYDLGEGVMGAAGVKHMPFIIGIGFYVAVSNLLGLVPGCIPPTMNINTTAAAAVSVFLYYHIMGFKTHGIGYIKQFTGPVIFLAPLMMLIEVVGHFARPLSLSLRLFGNINGEEIIVSVLFTMIPLFVPLPMYIMLLFSGILQAVVFMLLSMVYLGGAIDDAH